ncbi:MAG: CDGSH iron-sulfur domain-containing protein [Bacteroidota bacterium]
MENEKKASNGPKTLTLLKGQRLMWCACGLSDDSPYCDNSHVMSDVEPVRYQVEAEGLYTLCMCTHTKNAPFCDGSHKLP